MAPKADIMQGAVTALATAAQASRRGGAGGPDGWEATLTASQREAFDAIRSGANALVTGSGGTGKSYLVDGVIRWAHARGLGTIVCAPTGIAALNVGGTTIHRMLGLSAKSVLGPRDDLRLPADSPLPQCDIMIVDEISMCRLDLFDYLSSSLDAAARARGGRRCQLVAIGDFLQLPPVVTRDDAGMLARMYGRDVRGGYPFLGDSWDGWGFRHVPLREAVRQSDGEFVDALGRIRLGDMSGAEWIQRHAPGMPHPDAIVLCGTNAKASAENSSRLGALPGRATTYRGSAWGDVRASDMPTEVRLSLKPGARVMAVVNEPTSGFMNGSLGTVTACRPDHVDVRFDDGHVAAVRRHVWEVCRPQLDGGRIAMQVVGEFEQVPLRLAWAITIHKSQGQTFEHAVVHPRCWDYGQLYTALSRLTDVGGLCLAEPIRDGYLKASPDALGFERRLDGAA